MPMTALSIATLSGHPGEGIKFLSITLDFLVGLGGL